MKKQPLTTKEPDINTAVALYARVSSDRQDVDLSVAAQLRALRDYAEKNGHIVVGEYIDEAESGRIADRPEFRKMLDEASKPTRPSKRFSSGSSRGSLGSGSTPSRSNPCSGGAVSASFPSQSTPTTLQPASSWRPSSRASMSSTPRTSPKKSHGGCERPRPEDSGCPLTNPLAIEGSKFRTGPRSAHGWNSIRLRMPSCAASSIWCSGARPSWT